MCACVCVCVHAGCVLSYNCSECSWMCAQSLTDKNCVMLLLTRGVDAFLETINMWSICLGNICCQCIMICCQRQSVACYRFMREKHFQWCKNTFVTIRVSITSRNESVCDCHGFVWWPWVLQSWVKYLVSYYLKKCKNKSNK